MRMALLGGLGVAAPGLPASRARASGPGTTAPGTTAVAPGRFGAQTHYSQQGWGYTVAERLRALDIPLNRVRDELYWSVLERSPGVYDWSYGDPAMARIAAGGTGLILGCGFGNPLYDSPGKSFPDTAAARAAFADYVYAVLDRYARPGTGRHPGMFEAIEIWNEANEHWSGGYTAQQAAPLLAQLTLAVAARVRADPDFDHLPILGCAPVHVPLNFIKWCFDAGIGPAIQKVVVHPYGSPEALMRDVGLLRAQLDAGGHDQAIWATEFGNIADPDEMLRLLAACAAAPLEIATYYLSKSSGGFSSGLIDGANAITPVGRVWAAWAGMLDDAVYLGRDPLQARTYVLRFRRADGLILRVCWSHWGSTLLHAPGGQAFDSLGALLGPGPYQLGRAPIVILGAASVWEDLGGEIPVAESFSGFSLVQGQNGWTYRYRRRWGGNGDMIVTTGGQYGDGWGVSGATYASIGANGAHPDRIGVDPVTVVRRWEAGQAGLFRVTGSVTRAAGSGDGVDVAVEHRGVALFSRQGVKGAPVEFDLSIQALNGDAFDFVTGPAAEQTYDSTEWRIRIALVGGVGTAWAYGEDDG